MNFQFFKDSSAFSLGPVSVQPRRNMIIANGAAVRVEPRVMAVLMRLKQAGGDVVSRETLIEDVWGDEPPNDEALTQAISRLRRAVGDNSASPKIIETIPKHGYRLMCEPDVTVTATAARAGAESVGKTENAIGAGAASRLHGPAWLTQTHLLWAAIAILGGLFLYSTIKPTPMQTEIIEIFLEEE